MFVFDVETLGKESNSVILSMAAIYFNPDEQPDHKKLFDEAFFVKFDVPDQMKRLDRKVGKSTMEWWAKQCDNVRIKSFKPNPDLDVKFETGYEAMRQWAKSKNDDKCYVWARGSMDEVVMQALERSVMCEGEDHIFLYSRFRDVRTAIDFLTGNINGYCQVDHPSFNYDIDVTKHNPIDDCALDIMMLIYGK